MTTSQLQKEDPWLWLEAPKSAGALDWARRETAATKAYFSASPLYAQAFDELTELLENNPPPPNFAFFGDRLVRFRRDIAHPNGVLEVAERDADGMPRSWRAVFDVDAFRKVEGVPYELHWLGRVPLCLDASTGRCLLHLSPGGSDEEELREFDLAAGQFVADGFRLPASRVQAVWLSKDRLLITTTLSSDTRTAAGWGDMVQIWTRGEPLSSAPAVAQSKPTDAFFRLMAVGHGAECTGIVSQVIDFSTFSLSCVDQAGRMTPIDLPQALKPFGVLAMTRMHLVVQLAKPTMVGDRVLPAETLLAYDVRSSTPDAERASVVYMPAEGEVVGNPVFGVAATASRVYFIVDRRLSKRIVGASFDGVRWTSCDETKGEIGTALNPVAADPEGEDFVVEQTGFTMPSRLDLVRPGQPPRTLHAENAAFDASLFVTEVRSTKSKDGTQIDYYLLRPKNPARPGATPTLMTGYGAFGISFFPAYLGMLFGGPALKLWLDRGGAFVLPIIRGGGERGAAWHQSAMRENRQRSYDDFIAVAEALANDGFTTAKRIGVFGVSNGGLLSATVAIQRPEAFGAAVSDAPLTDMLRLCEMGMGGAWTNEYGHPDDPVMRKALLGYSPYQNVKTGVAYPPFLITVSTEDNRVGPGHARKLAARLKEVGAPAYFYEDEEGGHAVSDALSRPDLMALRMTFLISTLMSQALG